ncbi:hypothetical protein BH10PLA2_BH10PLA2_40300 [soil metagenome]
MLAGACAAVQPKPYYSRRGPEEANRFLRGLRMGQTERGSFVLTVYTPVSPSLQSNQFNLFGEPEPPFERRAVTRLASALVALRRATDEALKAPNTEIFQKVVGAGVSGNMCSAIVGMNGPNVQPADELRLSFTYARSRPIEVLPPEKLLSRANTFA